MGIQLSYFEKTSIDTLAQVKSTGGSIYPYLFGALGSSVDLFVEGHNKTSDLASMWASVKRLDALCKRYNAEELREIASGTREVAEEDVQSGR